MIKLEDIKFKIGSTFDKSGAILLVYIDARTARRELNERFGFGNWQFGYSVNDDKSVHGVLKIRQEKEWLSFEDVGYCGNNYSKEPLKDAVSDATKRCCVQVGIGEILYDAPFLWADWGMLKIGKDGKAKKLLSDAEKIIQGKVNEWYNKLSKTE